MPRRKKTFIDRSRATTYQLVPGSDGSSTLELNSNSPNVTEANNTELTESYNRTDFELGEFGFPDTDYNYSKHFRTIGGTGGVYLHALTEQQPSELNRGRYGGEAGDSKGKKTAVLLRDSFAEEEPKPHIWTSERDDINRLEAFEKMVKESKHNNDLKEVMQQLNVDDETDADHEEQPMAEIGQAEDARALAEFPQPDDDDEVTEDEEFPDDFIALANLSPDDEQSSTKNATATGERNLNGLVERYREPRLLDAQFDDFMRGFQLDSTDEEFEECRADLLPRARNDNDFEPQFEDTFRFAAAEADELTREFNSMFIEPTEGNDSEARKERGLEEDDEGIYGDDEAPELEPAGEEEEEDEEDEGERAYDEYEAAEFENGMSRMMESRKRVPAEDALHSEDISLVRLAAERQGAEELERIKRHVENGQDEDHDSELETLFEEMAKEKEEKWDCETIISTYTNTENRPSMIDAPVSRKRRSMRAQPIIRLDPRTQAPVDYMPERNERSSESLDYGSRRDGVETTRRKGESKEEKKARKLKVKEAARERRALKSEMRRAFGQEHAKQERHAASMGSSKVSVQF